MNTISNAFSIQSYHKQFIINDVQMVNCKCKIQMTLTVVNVNCLGRQPNEKQSFSGRIFGNGNL